MALKLLGIFCCAWIISVECVCNGIRSDGGEVGEKSWKDRELSYLEGTWSEKAQNEKYGDDNLFDARFKGKGDEVREIEKQKKILKKNSKPCDDGSGEIGKVQKLSHCDEWKMRKNEGMRDESVVEGCLVLANSSIKLNSLALMERSGKGVIGAENGCFVELSGCIVGVERKTSPFYLCGSCGLLTNISLRFSSTLTSTKQIFPRLFSPKVSKGEISENCYVSICSSHFSSFYVSSAPFISSSSIPFVSLSKLTFFNISTAIADCPSPTTSFFQTSCFMSSCSFSSVHDVYDGGIVSSLNNPYASFSTSNTSFVGCSRTRNVECTGSEDNTKHPKRQQITDNGANSFTWCMWNGSNTTGTSDSVTDGVSSGGAIFMHKLNSGVLFVSRCLFNNCFAHSRGGGIMCHSINSIKIENNSFNICTAQNQYGGGLCTASTPYGHDVYFEDYYNLFSSNNPFFESYTTNTNEKRVCYSFYLSDWTYQQTEKKDWLKDKILDRFVGVNGDDSYEKCGEHEILPCKTVGYAVDVSIAQLSSIITVLGGKHVSEGTTINVGEKKISVVGKGKEVSVIGTGALSSSSTTLFSVTSGQLEVWHVGIDHNATRSPSPSVFVVSLGSGTLSLEDVAISSSVNGESGISASVFVMALSQLRMSDVEIKNMKMNQPLFTEPSSAGSSSGESILGNLTVQNMSRTGGDGVVLAKSVKAGETFVVWNTTMEGCECVNGNGGGIKVELESSTSKVRVGTSTSHSGGTIKFDKTKCSGYGGGMMLHLEDNSFDFEITSVSFAGCAAALGGKNLFVEAQDLSAVISSASIGFNPEIGIDVAELNELCGKESGKPELIVPLVVFLRTSPSPAYVSGREQGSEFRQCGYEDYPCKGIENAGEVQFKNSKRMIRLTRTFSFDEEVKLNEESYEIDSSDKNVGLKVGGTGTKTQEALVMNSVSSTFTRILFELGGSIGERSSFVQSSEGTLRFVDCGMKMGNGVDTVSYEFVSASGGKVEIIRMRCGGNVGNVGFVGSVIVVNGSCECLMDEMVINQTTSNGAKGLIEIATSSSAAIQNCSIANSILPSCGAIQVEKCSSITLKNTSFENITRGAGDGGCVNVDSNEDGSQDIIRIENCSFTSCEVTENGKGGGGLSVSLENPSELHVSSTRFEKCCAPSTSGSEGKGGGMFLSLMDSDAKFELSDPLVFDGNWAEYGKNIFILSKDLNCSVTNDSFKFDYSSMKDDKTLFVGSDTLHSDKDLFMFLVPYSSFEIFISSEGFDVKRCGSEEEPCFTMWKGMENMKKEIGKKTIQIEGSIVIRDSFNMSNYQIKKGVKMGEENVKAILNFEKAIGSQLEYFMGNDIYLELTDIKLQLTNDFVNSAKTIISNREGELIITGCSLHSEAGVNNGINCVFVDVIGGSVEVNDLLIESCNVGNSIFSIHDSGITCHFVNVRVESLNESGGCILSIKKSEPGLKINEEYEDGVNPEIDNSSFSGVKRSDNGASILESKSEKKICLVVNVSNMTEDKAETSEKGGGIFFTLGKSGLMKIVDSTISHCSCSIDSGRGGGVYLATNEREKLDFSFVGLKFSDNRARVGNDVFIECYDITSQINEKQFQFDLREGHYDCDNAICGKDECDYPSDTDLIGFVTIHQSDTIIVNSVNGSNERQCGTNTLPCASIDYGLMHLTSDFMSVMIVVDESVIEEEINLEEMSLSSKSRNLCDVEVETGIEKTKEALITTTGEVSLLKVNFVFDSNFISSHESLISPEGGILEVMDCSFTTKQLKEVVNAEFANIPFHIINMEKGELQLDGCTLSNLILQKSALHLSSSLPSVIYLFTVCNSTIETSLIDINECGQLTIKDFNTENITVEGNEESLISCLAMKKTMQLTNCTMDGVSSKTTKGKLMKLEDCLDVKMDSCIFDGSTKERNEQTFNEGEEMCRWSGSLVDVVKSSVMMKDTTISNSPEGGITMRGGNVNIEKGEFINNNPSVEGYPSLRRNIICSDSGTLNVMSLKGGDGLKDNSSLWMLNDGCTLDGIAGERSSPFFIPKLEEASVNENGSNIVVKFKGSLFVPCDLSFRVVNKTGDVELVETYEFEEDSFVSEAEVIGTIPSANISTIEDETEISVMILFGKQRVATSPQILKNKTESKTGKDRVVEGGKKEGSIWPIIVIVMGVILFVILVIAVISTVRWKKAKNENKDLREIVNDNIRKDPKAYEMVTMEMSPEEQWKRAEREAEKKNEERIKKRVYGKKMAHSESEENLLSESGSTEYILGKDSDKIPDWELEKDDEEEIRKRTPSPSVSSISTTDSDTTFVRMEDACPTTSSMSNLVDAMACSSPHEKLIVDLRDSLFMLLHGKNEKKEMAIGSLKEREQTAAQILFWVANLALHSFDEIENPLQSLATLSPHIVLFSEHMVICVAMHSDFLSSDDSDSSSISSSTVVTSASEDDDEDSLPSSAFEDDDYYKKECLRWKAPELMNGTKQHATKKTAVFSIGMMLWECLTLQIPFGEYEAVVAGQKIVNGERPVIGAELLGCFNDTVAGCLSPGWQGRPTLVDLKREFIQRFPAGSVMLTVSDAIDVAGGAGRGNCSRIVSSGSGSGSESWFS
ncbi:uncharacterized protein MONOS_388 [Monocercomonoides exilis]|uniref:uncharacterized protein n=1 Tax=Monocercomonoides exilis TaxID=2049356 RepID=UPI00355A5171|nr:hypothetical protein MONOS_388 [Monocercomonoides exilis]|eukprot:MONOS_388.1-p1 / transcript=MONOS_388.1 / gene=MONOS_388 / organism=Monocercomonoides_exilis_PA203 / gene_product=unspecified product / transcript_product=unspecified product / location=Mono_scaffold00006:180112-188238(-) / protein_length=2584 / sequence_SO=supercontig / SO=protein_coding / is_pseudo=false